MVAAVHNLDLRLRAKPDAFRRGSGILGEDQMVSGAWSIDPEVVAGAFDAGNRLVGSRDVLIVGADRGEQCDRELTLAVVVSWTRTAKRVREGGHRGQPDSGYVVGLRDRELDRAGVSGVDIWRPSRVAALIWVDDRNPNGECGSRRFGIRDVGVKGRARRACDTETVSGCDHIWTDEWAAAGNTCRRRRNAARVGDNALHIYASVAGLVSGPRGIRVLRQPSDDDVVARRRIRCTFERGDASHHGRRRGRPADRDVTPSEVSRRDGDPGGGDKRIRAVVAAGPQRVALVGGGNPDHLGIAGGIRRAGGAVVAGRGDEDHTFRPGVADRVLQALTEAAVAERHQDHVGAVVGRPDDAVDDVAVL